MVNRAIRSGIFCRTGARRIEFLSVLSFSDGGACWPRGEADFALSKAITNYVDVFTVEEGAACSNGRPSLVMKELDRISRAVISVGWRHGCHERKSQCENNMAIGLMREGHTPGGLGAVTVYNSLR